MVKGIREEQGIPYPQPDDFKGPHVGVCREEERLKAELNGGAYPRSCPTCGLLGPCVKGHTWGSKTGAGSEIIAPHIKKLLGLIRSWQDEHDLRPSEVEFALIAAATVFAPTKKT